MYVTDLAEACLKFARQMLMKCVIFDVAECPKPVWTDVTEHRPKSV